MGTDRDFTRSAASIWLERSRSDTAVRRCHPVVSASSAGDPSDSFRSARSSSWVIVERLFSASFFFCSRAAPDSFSEVSLSASAAASSASRRALASRTLAPITSARRAVSACRARGPSCFLISSVRSSTRERFPAIWFSFEMARSFRRRCFSTPAASSMKPRRSSGVDDKMASSCPCPTITCICLPMPVSERSS